MTTSHEWFERARLVMPGGVNSPARAFKGVGAEPVFVTRGEGAFLETVGGHRLIDFIASWGALIFGHAEPEVVDALVAAVEAGTSFGVPTPGEVEYAEIVTRLVPSMEVVRMVNSGTEATAAAIRVARGVTGRDVVVKFEGCYHGHADAFLVKAGSGLATFGEPDSPGVPTGTAGDTRVVAFNDLDAVEVALAPGDVAAVIIEGVVGNMGVVPPDAGFLEGIRALCDRHGSLLILDEVMTGFRVAPGGVQERWSITPDLTCLGKIVAGGTAAAVYGGRADLMRHVAPDGAIYQAGTLAGNPLAVAAGLATLRRLERDPGLHERLEEAGARLEAAVTVALEQNRIRGTVQRVGAMLTLFFGVEKVRNWDDASRLDREMFSRFHAAALRRGVLLPPSPFEAWFLMEAHLGDPLERAIEGVVASLEEIA